MKPFEVEHKLVSSIGREDLEGTSVPAALVHASISRAPCQQRRTRIVVDATARDGALDEGRVPGFWFYAVLPYAQLTLRPPPDLAEPWPSYRK